MPDGILPLHIGPYPFLTQIYPVDTHVTITFECQRTGLFSLLFFEGGKFYPLQDRQSFTFDGMRKVGAEQVLDERLNQLYEHFFSFFGDYYGNNDNDDADVKDYDGDDAWHIVAASSLWPNQTNKVPPGANLNVVIIINLS